jgi:DNA-binding IclR family transcriptional regulator
MKFALRVMALRDGGMTYQAIADQVGLSRQRVHQIATRLRKEL